VIQHKSVLPTTAPIKAQRDAILERVGKIVDVAALCGVNVLCFQEAWSEYIRINSNPCIGM
jgi:beta-ureidopropionase